MSDPTTIPAINGATTVRVPIEKAFRVFTSSFNTWWPHEFHIGQAEMAKAILEPRAGGRWYERGWTAANATGAECWHGSHRFGFWSPGRSTAPGSTTPIRNTTVRTRCGSQPRDRNGPGLSSNTDTSIDSLTAERYATGSARAVAGAASWSSSPGPPRARTRWKGCARHIKPLSHGYSMEA